MDTLRPVCGKKTVSPNDPSLPPLTSPPLMKDSSHSPVVTARPSHGQVRRGFAALAKRVIQEERKRKEEKQDRVEQEGEMFKHTHTHKKQSLTKTHRKLCVF